MGGSRSAGAWRERGSSRFLWRVSTRQRWRNCAGQFVARNPFDRFNRGNLTNEDRFFYGAFYCSQAMFQIGGKEWEEFYAILLDTMAENQRSDGSWDLEANQDQYLGYAYTTSLAVLSLTPPFQLLPIYQR